MMKRYLGIGIRTRHNENNIIIDYNFDNVRIPTKEANMVFAVFVKTCEIHNIEEGFNPILSSSTYIYKSNEKITDEIFDKFNKAFFDILDQKLEIMLKLVFDAMDTDVYKFIARYNGHEFDVLKYFMDYETLPELDMFYKCHCYKYDHFDTVEFMNIKRTDRYIIIDYSESNLKRNRQLKNKYVILFNGKTVKRCIDYKSAFEYIKNNVKSIYEN